MLIIIRLLHGFIDTVLTFIFYNCYFDKKKGVTYGKGILIISIIALLDALIKNYYGNVIVTSIVSIATTYSLSFLLFSGKREIKFLVSTLVFLLGAIIDYVVAISLSIFYAMRLSLIQDNGFIIVLSTILFWSLKFMLVLHISRRRSKTTNEGDRNSYIQQIVIPLVCTIFILVFISIELMEENFNIIRCYATIFTILIINIVHYILFENKEKLYQENYNNMLLQEKYKYREEYYRNIEKYQEEIRVIKHDLKNQLIRITAYDGEKAIREINLMVDNLVKVEGVSFTKNIGINSILNVKFNQAKTKGIKCEVNIKFPEFIQFEEKDIAGIVGNVIDNAIEGAERSKDEKVIKFNLFYYNKMLVIHLENTTDGNVKNFETRKKNKKEHGLGTKSIHSIIEKYNGTSTYVIKDNWFKIEINLWSF